MSKGSGRRKENTAMSRAQHAELKRLRAMTAELEAKRDREAVLIAAWVHDQRIAQAREGREL